jgi:hypothetical protein
VDHTCSKTDLTNRRDGPVSLTTITIIITTRIITISFTRTYVALSLSIRFRYFYIYLAVDNMNPHHVYYRHRLHNLTTSVTNDTDEIAMAGLPADFPLRIASLSQIMEVPAPIGISPLTTQFNGSAATPAAPAPLKPVITLVNVFPGPEGHVYHDARDTKPKPDAYITVQRKILQWLDVVAADMLTPEEAAAWTNQIDPIGRSPSSELAMSLCYYMREQGFNTYCRLIPFKDSFELYVANPMTSRRGPQVDTRYWHQSYKTGTIRELGLRQAARGRRGAFQADPGFGLLGNSMTAARQRVLEVASRVRTVRERSQISGIEMGGPAELMEQLLGGLDGDLAQELRGLVDGDDDDYQDGADGIAIERGENGGLVDDPVLVTTDGRGNALPAVLAHRLAALNTLLRTHGLHSSAVPVAPGAAASAAPTSSPPANRPAAPFGQGTELRRLQTRLEVLLSGPTSGETQKYIPLPFYS